MRLDKQQRKALKSALRHLNKDDQVFLFGSRVDDKKLGGDIDLLIFSKQDDFGLSRKITRDFFKQCEEKIDVVVVDPKHMTREQALFVQSINKVPLMPLPMITDRKQQLQIACEKYRKVYELLEASVNKTAEFDSKRNYSADQLEPYDALSDRFIRTVELAIKFFRTYEYYMRVEQSQTLRDGLHQMEKLGAISSIDIWLDMRDIRNRIVDDYVPEQIAKMYYLVRNAFYEELTNLNQFVEQIKASL